MPKNIMAFDYGDARVGVAIANSLIKIAHPLAIINGKNKAQKMLEISKVIKKWQPSQLIVGTPSIREDNQLLLAKINNFKKSLEQKFKLPTTFINEDYTSVGAVMQLNEQNIMARDQKHKLDSLAACNILQNYFNYGQYDI